VKEVRNEQRKLLAAWFNNVGTGIISVGVLTPAVARILGAASSAQAETILLVMAFSFLIGFGFNLVGTLVLLGYEP
jgi:sensor histidine kinase regulating citrate/malate metabolism